MMRTLKSLLLAAGLCALSGTASQAQLNVSISVAPPELITYEQPLCPTDGYLWTPGYWGYDAGYYWVPGVWVAPPRIGFLWTPGYWGYGDGFYAFHSGYWGPTVGFYGGVNYGFGYGGRGYYGGGWQGNTFRYNTAITRVNTAVIHNTYVDNHYSEHVTNSRASFNGRGGVTASPTAAERQAASGPHAPPVAAQMAQRQNASHDQNARAPGEAGHAAAAGQPYGGHSAPGSGGERPSALTGGRQAPGSGAERVPPQANDHAAKAQARQQHQSQPRPEQAQPPRQQGEARQQQAQAQQARHQAAAQHPQGGERREAQQAHAKAAPRPQKEGGSHEGKKEEKH